jgi:histidine triad (HIT) family protein
MDYDNNNIFAKILRKELPCEIVYEDKKTLSIMDIMPRADGHMLVIPKSACRNILDASNDQLSACMDTVQKLSNAAMVAFGVDGITVQQFNEAAGGQEVFHLHFHVLPRKNGLSLKPHDGKMANENVLKSHANKIRAFL